MTLGELHLQEHQSHLQNRFVRLAQSALQARILGGHLVLLLTDDVYIESQTIF